MTFAAIIFDMDGTLVDSEVVWQRAEEEMFAERGIIYDDDARQQVIGLRLDEFFIRLKDYYGLDEDVDSLRTELIDRMQALIPEVVKPKPGAAEIIQHVIDSGIPFCIASSSPMSIIESTVKAQNWQDKFQYRYTADSVAKGKPAPDVYLYAAEKLGVEPAQCLAIEDSPNGAKSAVAAGMTTYVVPDGHTPAEAFSKITPHVFTDLHAILKLIR